MHRKISRAARNNNNRIVRNLSRMRAPKSVMITRGGFCKYGRVHVNRGISIGPDRIDPEYAELIFGSRTMVVPVGGNQNNNWRI